VAEGAPLLREYGYKTPIEGSNPSLSAKLKRPRKGLFNLGERGCRVCLNGNILDEAENAKRR
jgi:hypothetical protein